MMAFAVESARMGGYHYLSTQRMWKIIEFLANFNKNTEDCSEILVIIWSNYEYA